jgi:hypothetical protein
MKKLLIKFPTRSRPDKFKEVLQKYINNLSGTFDVRFVITADNDDETMNNPEMREWFDGLIERGIDLAYHYGDSKTKIEAVNANMEDEEADVLLLASDDMVPQMFGYDAIIMQSMEEAFPEFDGAIKFSDGLRPVNDPLMTLAVLGWKLYKKFGYIYYPEYKSLYADDEQTQACIMMGKFAMSPMCIIKHDWVHGGHPDADELHKEQEAPEMYAKDKKTFEERKKIGFGVSEMV